MFKEILFLGVDSMRHIRPSQSTVVISILDRSEAESRPRLGGFRGVLTLEFEDTYEEIKLAKPGSWPDDPTDDEHVQFAQGQGERVPTLTDATKIIEFLKKHNSSPETFTLVVHCYGGISRSAAVASWAAVRYWVPIATMRSTDYANKRLMRLMDKADNRR